MPHGNEFTTSSSRTTVIREHGSCGLLMATRGKCLMISTLQSTPRSY